MHPNPYTYWTSLTDDAVTVDDITRTLSSITDDLWVAAAATDRAVDDVEVQRALLELGIARTVTALQRSKEASELRYTDVQRGEFSNNLSQVAGVLINTDLEALRTYFMSASRDAQLCNLHAVLLQRLDRLNTFIDIKKDLEFSDETDEWEDEDDPWSISASSKSVTDVEQSFLGPSISLPTFLSHDIVEIALGMASQQRLSTLQILMTRHRPLLWPYRFKLIEAIPEHVFPSDFCGLLPFLDPSQNVEFTHIWQPWRSGEDWSESPKIQAVLRELLPGTTTHDAYTPHHSPLTADELSAWYKCRIETIINTTGFIDVSLAIIQYAASTGIPNLDEIGEDLSLLSRLVYDVQQNFDIVQDWTLDRWYSSEPSAIVRAYLAHSTPESVHTDITRLVLPYLFVLESRAERSGIPDPNLPTRLLYEYVLSAPLEIVAAIFEASKPTSPTPGRLIKSDEDLVRLALACLYANDGVEEWSIMNEIFECLPEWDISPEKNNGIMESTLFSLEKFISSVDHPHHTSSDLFSIFKSLSKDVLSRALDTLDVHLESGEILSRWGVLVPLRWFLQSMENISEQRALANKMARQDGITKNQPSTVEDWGMLLENVLKLSGRGDSGISGAFGLLTQREMLHIFMKGLLNAGHFDVVRGLLQPSAGLQIESSEIEDICLECSQEFYDNSQSGNYKFGDMKLAYDCLDVPQQTERVLREKEFIEATSRISSFNVTSRPGIPIFPIEIRLTSDRLSLISRVLSSNNDAYKHTEVMLDLVRKLGFRQDVAAEVKTLAMIADTALQAEDFSRAYEVSERMVSRVLEFREALVAPTLIHSHYEEVREVCWVACYQLGRQPEFHDVEKKLSLLGRALELCPPDKLHDILISWARLEKEDLETREHKLSENKIDTADSTARNGALDASRRVASSLRARLQDFHMPSPPMLSTPDAAALASRTFKTVTANFPFSVGHPALSQTSDSNEKGSRSISFLKSEAGDVSTQATRAITKGIGWLIGAEDEH